MSERTALGVGTFLVAAVVLWTTLASPAVAASITVSPDQGPAGSVVAVEGGGFLPLVRVSICFDKPGCSNLGSVVASVLGSFAVSVVIPDDAAVGGHGIFACQGSTCSETRFEVTVAETTTTSTTTTTTTSTTTTTTTSTTTTTTSSTSSTTSTSTTSTSAPPPTTSSTVTSTTLASSPTTSRSTSTTSPSLSPTSPPNANATPSTDAVSELNSPDNSDSETAAVSFGEIHALIALTPELSAKLFGEASAEVAGRQVERDSNDNETLASEETIFIAREQGQPLSVSSPVVFWGLWLGSVIAAGGAIGLFYWLRSRTP